MWLRWPTLGAKLTQAVKTKGFGAENEALPFAIFDDSLKGPIWDWDVVLMTPDPCAGLKDRPDDPR